jgi:isoquinoline 1-oxidoreductase beta subunit
MGSWTRRGLLAAGGLIGGGLVLGVALAPRRLSVKGDAAAITTWVRIGADNRVTVFVPHCDVGQGAQTGLAMMLAEEMDAAWNQVDIQEAPALPHYANGYMVTGLVLGLTPPAILGRVSDAAALALAELVGLQVTGGSASIRITGEMGMRVAGAAARQMLIQAAATRWGVPTADCMAKDGAVMHAASGRRLEARRRRGSIFRRRRTARRNTGSIPCCQGWCTPP